jgi:hypothetical protein
MKNFKKYITEVSKTTDSGYAMDDVDFSNDLADSRTLARINSFLGAMGDIEYLVPEHALNKMQEKLGRLALSFDMPTLDEDGGILTVPLTQFGGRFGKDENGDINDDGISHRIEGGLQLEIVHEPTGGGTHFVRARIV